MTAPAFIETVHHGTNAHLIAQAARLYIPDGALVADVTYGKGVFWKRTDVSRFTLLASDLLTCPDAPYDFRHLPYEDGSIDVLVCDPPYLHNPGVHVYDHQYQIGTTTAGLSHDEVMQLYQDGMREARRVLKPSGSQLWVKCKDEVSSGQQRWSHMEIFQMALGLGFRDRDMLVLVAKSSLLGYRWQHQIHARKTHSYLWIFTLGRVRLPRRPDERLRPCAHCSTLFLPQRRTGRYCRGACRVAAFRARQVTLTPLRTEAM